jgi:adenine-specific DNA-methyltransferase
MSYNAHGGIAVETRSLPSKPLPSIPLRYMGTKRLLGPVVRDELLAVSAGRVADLFCGMGSVAAGLASERPIFANDAAAFAACIARARFLDCSRPKEPEVVRQLVPLFRESHAMLRKRFVRRLKAEKRVLDEGTLTSVRELMDATPHAGNSSDVRHSVEKARKLTEPDDYRLATLYFSASYFSIQQAIEIDALRFAIDHATFDESSGVRDWLLSAWLSAAGSLVNAPGHTAQFLKPTTTAVAARVVRQWSRSMWEGFVSRLGEVALQGNREWRQENIVTCLDALDLVKTNLLDDAAAVYADPPYTVDHYSRFYHVYETLYLYDFPESVGIGRYRGGRFFTAFSRVGEVEKAFTTLTAAISAHKKPLVISYPSKGVLSKAGIDLRNLLEGHFSQIREIQIQMKHSTLGGSTGEQSKQAMELVYVCKP